MSGNTGRNNGLYAVGAAVAPGKIGLSTPRRADFDELPSDASGNVPRTYAAVGNTDREKSYFLNMYLRDSRALDYLLTHADWDGKTIVLIGGSMGGQ